MNKKRKHRKDITKMTNLTKENDWLSMKEFKKCWALKNLQPLWAIENIKKGNSDGKQVIAITDFKTNLEKIVCPKRIA